MAADEGNFVLELPAASEYLGTARLFVVALARHFGCDEEAVENARLAVSEACTHAVRSRDASGGSDPVTLRATKRTHRLRFEIEDVGPEDGSMDSVDGDGLGGNGVPQMLGLQLVGALADDMEIGPSASGGTRVMFSIATRESSPRA